MEINRIDELFKSKQQKILSVYFTAGFPKLNDTIAILHSLQESGADIVELGIPFSDPLADGPVIQKSSETALKNGMSIAILFRQLKDFRKHIHIPVLLMGYFNPILQYGVEQFLKEAAELGIDGLIVPDLPLHEYEKQYAELFKRYKVKNILLVTPQTVESRIRYIDELCNGFIYVVSSASTTGQKDDLNEDITQYLERIKQYKLKNPALVGFGISNARSFQLVSQFLNGAIVGSAFIKTLEKPGNQKQNILQFIQSIKQP